MKKAFTKKLEEYPVYNKAPRGITYKRISVGSSVEPVEVDYAPIRKGRKIEGHRHAKSNALCFILEGSGTILLNNKRVKIKKNDVINIPVGTWHEFSASKKEKLAFLSIQYPPLGDDFIFYR